MKAMKLADTDVSEEHPGSILIPEDGVGMSLRNVHDLAAQG